MSDLTPEVLPPFDLSEYSVLEGHMTEGDAWSRQNYPAVPRRSPCPHRAAYRPDGKRSSVCKLSAS